MYSFPERQIKYPLSQVCTYKIGILQLMDRHSQHFVVKARSHILCACINSVQTTLCASVAIRVLKKPIQSLIWRRLSLPACQNQQLLKWPRMKQQQEFPAQLRLSNTSTLTEALRTREHCHFSGALKLTPRFGWVKRPVFLPKRHIFIIVMQWFNKAAENCSY